MSDDESVLSVLARGSGVVFIGLVLELGFRLFGKVLVARVLGSVDFGTVALAMTLTGVVSTVMTIGLNTGIARFTPRGDGRAHERGVLISGFQVALPAAVAVGAVIVFLAGDMARLFGVSEATSAFRAAGVAIPLATFVKLTIGAIRGQKLTRPMVLLRSIAVPATRFALFVAAVALGFRAVGVAWAYTLGFALAAGVAAYYLYAYTPMFERTAAEVKRLEMLSYSVPVMVRNVMTMVLVHIDTFLIGAIASVAAVGVYNAVYPLAMLVTMSHKATNFLYLPLVSELDADAQEGEIESLYRTAARWLFLATVPVFVAVGVFPRAVISLTYGAEYVEGALALTVLAVGFFVHTVIGVNGGTLEAIGETRFVMIASTVTALVNVGANVALIPSYGLLGAAVATTASYILLNGMYTAYLYRQTGLVPFGPRFGHTAAGVAVLLVAVLAVKSVVGNGIVASLALGFAFLPAYAVVAARYAVAEEDIELLNGLESRLGVSLAPVKRALRTIAT